MNRRISERNEKSKVYKHDAGIWDIHRRGRVSFEVDGQESVSKEMAFHLGTNNKKELAMLSARKYYSRPKEQQIQRLGGNMILRKVKRKIKAEETA